MTLVVYKRYRFFSLSFFFSNDELELDNNFVVVVIFFFQEGRKRSHKNQEWNIVGINLSRQILLEEITYYSLVYILNEYQEYMEMMILLLCNISGYIYQKER